MSAAKMHQLRPAQDYAFCLGFGVGHLDVPVPVCLVRVCKGGQEVVEVRPVCNCDAAEVGLPDNS
eukprot:6697654-Lingulodinium_polyedra.AAC.1